VTWTPRNTVNVTIAGFLCAAIIYAQFADPSRPELQAFATAALAGLLIPGSPIGRGIDALLTTKPTDPSDPESGRVDPMILVWVVGFFATLSGALWLRIQ